MNRPNQPNQNQRRQQGQGGGGQQGGGGGGGRNRNRRRRRGGGGDRRHGGGQNRNPHDRGQNHQQKQQRPQDDIHPLDPMRFIKVPRNAAEPNRQAGSKQEFAVMFFDTVPQAMAAREAIRQKSSEVENLNIVIKAETDRNISELMEFGKIFTGEAWTIIHQRRMADGWYNEPHEAFKIKASQS